MEGRTRLGGRKRHGGWEELRGRWGHSEESKQESAMRRNEMIELMAFGIRFLELASRPHGSIT